MSKITVVVDAPDHGTDAFSPTSLVTLGHEVARLVRMQIPNDDRISLVYAAVEGDTGEPLEYQPYVEPVAKPRKARKPKA